MIFQRLAKYDFHEMTFARWFMQKTDNRALSSKYCRTLSYGKLAVFCSLRKQNEYCVTIATRNFSASTKNFPGSIRRDFDQIFLVGDMFLEYFKFGMIKN